MRLFQTEYKCARCNELVPDTQVVEFLDNNDVPNLTVDSGVPLNLFFHKCEGGHLGVVKFIGLRRV